tara:strand:+ start:626 stop:1267 length:642 start_codon:yes stop_codon:yes gene_type:complete
MNIDHVSPKDGWLQAQLDQNIVDYLWKLVRKNWKKKSNKGSLAGNISHSYILKDEDDFFYNQTLSPLIEEFKKVTGHRSFSSSTSNFTRNLDVDKLRLNTMWSNHQYKHEFNPIHYHHGVYSFVVWLAIPYAFEEQKLLPQFHGVKEPDIKPGCFEFQWLSMLGDTDNETYRLTPAWEGWMLFFPARLRHTVYPFYNTDKPRVSVSGNIDFKK